MSQETEQALAERRIKRPILLLGCPRSGTSLLGWLITAHPDVAYWVEPRTVWSTGNQSLPDDVLLKKHLTAEIAAEIDQRFADFMQQNGKSRFAEKTPSNMLRLPFIHALYPNCRIIHLVRDARPAVASALNRLESPPDLDRITARLREAKLRDWPGLAGLFFRDGIARLFPGGKRKFWGPRPPQWKEWRELPLPIMLSKQWLTLMETARDNLQQLPSSSWMEIRYEELATNHTQVIPKLLEFAELEPSEEVLKLADDIIQPELADAWKQEVTAELQQQIEAETAPMLKELGYPI